MIERKFVSEKVKALQVQEFIATQLTKGSHNKIEIKRTPLGEKIIVYTTRPGLIVGRKGENIRKLTRILKEKFKMENPQIEIGDIENPFLEPNSVVDRIVYSLERYGPKRFKFLGYDTLQTIMQNGAMGAEIIIGGRGVPGARAKSWRFSAGYLKKSGNVSVDDVLRAQGTANLRSGSIGVQVAIMPPNVKLPDKVKVYEKESEEIKKIAVEETKKEEEIKEPEKKKMKRRSKKAEAKEEKNETS